MMAIEYDSRFLEVAIRKSATNTKIIEATTPRQSGRESYVFQIWCSVFPEDR